jgi:hypothetical protein
MTLAAPPRELRASWWTVVTLAAAGLAVMLALVAAGLAAGVALSAADKAAGAFQSAAQCWEALDLARGGMTACSLGQARCEARLDQVKQLMEYARRTPAGVQAVGGGP